MEKINNREYKNKQKWPQYVYVCDFYSRQLAEIQTLLMWLIMILCLIFVAIMWWK